MRQMKISNSLDLVLSNEYLKDIIQSLELGILNVKVEVLFYETKNLIKPQLSH